MANFTVAFNKAGVTGLVFLIISIIYIANASGDTEIHNAIRDNPADSGRQHTLYCNGTWCIMNEQYCDKSANKCMACVYKPNCTQHLDCMQYCIDKGVEQAIHENQGTATEENSTPAWALPLFVVFLILFLVSCVGHLVVFLWWFHQRKQEPHGIEDPEEELSLTKDKENSDATEQKVIETEAATPTPIQEESSNSNEKSHEFQQ